MFIFSWVIRFFFKLVLLVISLAVLFYGIFNWPVKNENQKMPLGITFSNIYARDLGLDWKKAYLEILDSLEIKKIRLVAYWTEIEKKPGEYDFSDLDWQIEEAEKRDLEIILAMGIKVPRWPECFVPEFYWENKEKREEKLLEYEEKIIRRYQNSKAIKIWQIENEPFLPFGNCPVGFVDEKILDRELTQTRKMDTERTILMTDSGELSLWYHSAQRGDLFGTTLYKTIYNKKVGYFDYPIGPNFFRIKRFLVEKITGQKNFMIVELQGEPWGPEWVGDLSLEEQAKSMDAKKLQEMVEFAQKTNLSSAYLWGAEWWYWLKEEKKETAVWDMAKNLLKNNVVEK